MTGKFFSPEFFCTFIPIGNFKSGSLSVYLEDNAPCQEVAWSLVFMIHLPSITGSSVESAYIINKYDGQDQLLGNKATHQERLPGAGAKEGTYENPWEM